MFGLKKTGPDKAFSHTDDCKILAADPGVEFPWNETRTGHWEARCQCGVEHHDEPVGKRRARLDPCDPKTARHLGQCEFIGESDPGLLRVLLKVIDKESYAWVECGSCGSGWQVPHVATEGSS